MPAIHKPIDQSIRDAIETHLRAEIEKAIAKAVADIEADLKSKIPQLAVVLFRRFSVEAFRDRVQIVVELDDKR